MIKRCNAVAEDIKANEKLLLDIVEQCADFHENRLKVPPNGFCMQFGRVLLLGLETSWGLLNEKGKVEKVLLREIAIHPEVKKSSWSIVCADVLWGL